MSDDAFKNAVLAPTPAPYDPNAKHTLAEKIAHAVDVVKEAVVHVAEVVVHAEEVLVEKAVDLISGETDWEGEGYKSGGVDPEAELAALTEDGPKLAVMGPGGTPFPTPEILTHFGESDKASPDTNKVMADAVAAIATPDTESKTPDSAA